MVCDFLHFQRLTRCSFPNFASYLMFGETLKGALPPRKILAQSLFRQIRAPSAVANR